MTNEQIIAIVSKDAADEYERLIKDIRNQIKAEMAETYIDFEDYAKRHGLPLGADRMGTGMNRAAEIIETMLKEYKKKGRRRK